MDCAAWDNQWELVGKLIEKGADINATCIGEGTYKGKSVLAIAKDYNSTITNNTPSINKDIFYFMVIIEGLRSSDFEYPADVILTNKDKKIIKNLKNKINLYVKIFIPTSINFKDDNYYKKNHLNEL